MGTKVTEIVNIADNSLDDDEISILYVTPVPVKRGTSKIDAISVEDYPIKPKNFIDLSRKHSSRSYNDHEDDDVKIVNSSDNPLKRLYKGESSNSKSNKPAEIRVPSTFMCEICADEKPVSSMFRISNCNHSYCSECVSKYVASKLQDNITSINCPFIDCKGKLEPQNCYSILPKQVFDRWGDALCESLILASEKFYCPFKDCSALLIDDRSGSNEVVMESECPDCNRLFCVQCKVPWHSGIGCVEFQALKKDERSNEDLMLMNLAKKKKWKRCPECRFYVERTEGCLFMKCRCGYCFCYNCGAPLKDHYCTRCKR